MTRLRLDRREVEGRNVEGETATRDLDAFVASLRERDVPEVDPT